MCVAENSIRLQQLGYNDDRRRRQRCAVSTVTIVRQQRPQGYEQRQFSGMSHR